VYPLYPWLEPELLSVGVKFSDYVYFVDITIYSILCLYAEQNEKIVISLKINIIWKLYSWCSSGYGYTAKKNSWPR